MYHALGNALVVEMENLLPEMEVVDDKWTARTDAQRILIIGYRPALGGCQDGRITFRKLVKLATGAALELLVVDGGGGEI
jgi:hypothetical protein